jgi:hypothetical protein
VGLCLIRCGSLRLLRWSLTFGGALLSDVFVTLPWLFALFSAAEKRSQRTLAHA